MCQKDVEGPGNSDQQTQPQALALLSNTITDWSNGEEQARTHLKQELLCNMGSHEGGEGEDDIPDSGILKTESISAPIMMLR